MADSRLTIGAAAPKLELVGTDGESFAFDPAAAGGTTLIFCMRAFN